MNPNRDDLVGSWSEELGHIDDLSRDTVIQLDADGKMAIISGGERIPGAWECSAPGRLVMINENGHRFGPFRITIEKRQLPMGTFEVLQADGSLLPFDRRQFTRMESHAEQTDDRERE